MLNRLLPLSPSYSKTILRLYSTNSVPKATKSGSRLRSGLFGFLFGSSLTLFTGIAYLSNDVNDSLKSLNNSIQNVENTTFQIKDQYKKLNTLEERLNDLEDSSIDKKALAILRREMSDHIDFLSIENKKLQNQVFELEKLLNAHVDK
ncbi:hypothetical protein O9G_003670 [Rozella allomycis CSF55]|uniref:Uncharacterized protein n=1 Tax=Rozella allomycis (strain CSF55) TaxID=988480 RepID=A0A075B181_ROZAC|nr:hypothetical protein O9G_003670 [Rozella allomycis CSF55]|eukprot:EPZ36098.1 hypothetical protein O9G_003670 [Rozella allomycis CSF55]